jgi:hypothetical protein
MRLIGSLIAGAALLFSASCSMVDGAPDDSAKGFAVVELFTSEGCSSCPPADRVLSGLVADARKSGKPIYPLAFHVDYWNQLGWRDRFSTAGFSNRQRAYAAVMHTDRIYTPQLIVNGTAEFVGSDAGRADSELKTALAHATDATLKIDVQRKGSQMTITYESHGSTGASLNLAIVERGLQTAVKAGENDGNLLKHENVVRLLKTIDLPGSKETVEMTVPDGVKIENASVIAFTQDKTTLHITAATAADLPQ